MSILYRVHSDPHGCDGAVDAGSIHFSNPGRPGRGVVWNPESTIQNMESSDIVDGYRGECWGIMKKNGEKLEPRT